MSATHYARREVTTLPESASVVDLAVAMRRDAVGCVVIVDAEQHPVGVVTDRDLALRVVAAERDAGATNAASIMSHPVVTAGDGEPLERILEQMTRHGVRRIPIVAEDHVVGVLALDDVLARLGAQLDELAGASQHQIADAQLAARWPRLREEIESRLRDLGERAQKAGGRGAEALVREFEALRERLRRTPH